MQRRLALAVTVCTALAGCALLIAMVTFQDETTDDFETSLGAATSGVWDYIGERGPDTWGNIKGYKKCKSGKNQSPINIVPTKAVYSYRLPELDWQFEMGKRDPTVMFNGHTVTAEGNKATLNFDGKDWKLQEFIFHTPSENTLNGRRFPVEMQMLHTASNGEQLIVAWFFDDKEWAPSYIPELFDTFPEAGAWTYLKRYPGPDNVHFNNFMDLLVLRERDGHKYYYFRGSLTTPPCTEGVRWVVMTEILGINSKDVAKLERIEGKNIRPTQPINGRKVWKSFPDTSVNGGNTVTV